MIELSAEDEKIITLAKGAKARIGAKAGACVRDTDGRTYSAAAVSFAARDFFAFELAIATALSAGAKKLEAVCVVGEEVPNEPEIRTVLIDGGLIIICDEKGSIVSVLD